MKNDPAIAAAQRAWVIDQPEGHRRASALTAAREALAPIRAELEGWSLKPGDLVNAEAIISELYPLLYTTEELEDQ